MSDTEEDDGPGPTNRQVHVVEGLREYIGKESQRRDQTHSEFLLDVLPDSAEEADIGYEDDDVVYLKATAEVDDLVNDMTLDRARLSKGETIAFYVLLHALKRGDYDAVRYLSDETVEALWAALGGRA